MRRIWEVRITLSVCLRKNELNASSENKVYIIRQWPVSLEHGGIREKVRLHSVAQHFMEHLQAEWIFLANTSYNAWINIERIHSTNRAGTSWLRFRCWFAPTVWVIRGSVRDGLWEILSVRETSTRLCCRRGYLAAPAHDPYSWHEAI